MKRSAKAALAAMMLAWPAAAAASDTVEYTYDALGRINDVATTGGPNDGAAAATRYDPAGNRTSYSHEGTGPAPGSQSSAAGDEVVTGLEEEDIPADVPPALVEPPPPGGIPDESEPIVELPAPEGAAGAQGGDR